MARPRRVTTSRESKPILPDRTNKKQKTPLKVFFVAYTELVEVSCVLVPGAGVEPACLTAIDLKSIVSANFTTRA